MGHRVRPLHSFRTGSIIHKLASGPALDASPVMAIPQPASAGSSITLMS